MQEQDKLISSFESRITNSLKRNDIYTTEQLLEKTEIDLVHFTNMGWVSVDKIVKALKQEGLQLRFDPDQVSRVPRKRKPTKTEILKKSLKEIFSK